MRNSILTADLHLTSAERDAYRFVLFKQLRKWQKELRAKTLFILGDVTDAKDYHSSFLVNKVVDALTETAACFEHTYILKGNHDGVDPDTPYFRFLNAVPGVSFVVHPEERDVGGQRILMLPHTRTPEKDWVDFDFDAVDWILAHFTAAGAWSESGFQMDGLDTNTFRRTKTPIISGDVHIAQEIGNLTYVGTPYHVRFLENETTPPRCLYVDRDANLQDLTLKTLSRRTLAVTHPDQLAKCKYTRGDQVKVKITLPREEFSNWFDYRQQTQEWCKQQGLELVSIKLEKAEEQSKRVRIRKANKLTPEAVFDRYCTAKAIAPELAEAGRKLLRTAV